MKRIYLLMAFYAVTGCKRQDTLQGTYPDIDSASIDTTYQASTPTFSDSTSYIQDTVSSISLKPKYAIIMAVIAPDTDSALVRENISRYQSVGSDIIEMMDVSEDAKYRKMDEFEKTLYREGAVPSGMSVRKRKILVFDSYAQASKQREEFIK